MGRDLVARAVHENDRNGLNSAIFFLYGTHFVLPTHNFKVQSSCEDTWSIVQLFFTTVNGAGLRLFVEDFFKTFHALMVSTIKTQSPARGGGNRSRANRLATCRRSQWKCNSWVTSLSASNSRSNVEHEVTLTSAIGLEEPQTCRHVFDLKPLMRGP